MVPFSKRAQQPHKLSSKRVSQQFQLVFMRAWLEGSGKQRALAKTKQVAEEYRSALFYRRNPHEFTHYLLQVALHALVVIAILGIVVELRYLLAGVAVMTLSPEEEQMLAAPHKPFAFYLGFFLGQGVMIFGSVVVLKVCYPAVRMYARVQNFERYAEAVPAEIRDLDAERALKRLDHSA